MTYTIKTVRVQQYRSFRDETDLHLARLTLLYGINNSGKSALARLMPWISDSLASRQGSGLNIRSKSLFSAGFRQIRWAGGVTDDVAPQLSITLEYNESCWIKIGVRWFEEWSTPLVTEFSASFEGNYVEAQWVSKREERHTAARTFRAVSGEGAAPSEIMVRFEGPMPLSAELPWLEALSDVTTPLRDHVTWLGPVRTGPSRGFRVDVGQRGLLPNGEEAERIAYADEELRSRVSSFYEQIAHMRLEVSPLETGLAILRLSRTQDVPLLIDFPDAGEGLQQLFSVIVGLEQLRLRGAGDSAVFLVIEEPDSHLHPQTQRSLARRIVEILQQAPGAHVVLETHSEVLLTAIQTEVAAGRLSQDDVAVHWVEQSHDDGVSTASRIPLDDKGRFTSPELLEAFQDINEMRRELIAARRDSRAR